MSVLNKDQIKDIIKHYGVKNTQDVHNAVKDLMKDVIQATLEAELDVSLGYEKYERLPDKKGNARNGRYSKTVKSTFGNLDLDIPRDRDGEHEPLIVPKGEADVSNIQGRILSMCQLGLTTRAVKEHVKDIYGIDISAETISKITDQVLPHIRAWQARQLQTVYPIIYMDALHLNIRQDGKVGKKAVNIMIGIDCEGMKDVLGIWMNDVESAKFWLSVLTEVKNRGVKDVLIACVDGLTGFSEAINTVFPKTEVQRCIVHQIRNCCKFVNYKDRKEFCADMRSIYTAATEELALEALVEFGDKWGKKYGYAAKSWDSNWAELSGFLKYPDELRRIIYTTNPIESLNSSIKKLTGPKRLFPSDDAALKQVYFGVQSRLKKWTTRVRDWGVIWGQLSIYFEDRLKEVPQD